jgi:hypothetical protein
MRRRYGCHLSSEQTLPIVTIAVIVRSVSRRSFIDLSGGPAL